MAAKKIKLKHEYEELEELPDFQDYSDVHLKDNLFLGYEEQKDSLKFLINNAIGRGESGTVLIYGGHGSGKTEFGKCIYKSMIFKYFKTYFNLLIY